MHSNNPTVSPVEKTSFGEDRSVPSSISITHTSHILSFTDDEPPSCYTEKLEVTREYFFIFQQPKDQSDLNLQSRILSYCPPITVGVKFLFLSKLTPPLCSKFYPFSFVSLSTSKLPLY